MNKLPGLFMAATLALGSVSSVWADNAGTTGANLLNIPVSARAVGMGEAFTAMADNTSSLYWNPAGLALLNQSEASFLYSQWLKDVSYQHAAIGTPLEHGGIGASFTYLSYGHIDALDAQGNPAGEVSAYSGVGTLGGALYGEVWSAGATVKGIQTKLADVTATTFATDLGASVIYPKPVMGGTIRAAATLRNVGPGMKFIAQRDPLPRQWRLGISALELMNRKLNLSFDYGKERDLKGAAYGGAEFWLVPAIALRAGYAGSSVEGSGLRAGIGMKMRDVSFDYAFSSMGDLGLSHRYELTVRFGAIRPRLSAEQRAMLRRARLAMKEERYDEAVTLLDGLIETAPDYTLFRRLVKAAMRGLEGQEHSIKTANTFKDPTLRMSKPVAQDPQELADLENLLKMADTEGNVAGRTTGGR